MTAPDEEEGMRTEAEPGVTLNGFLWTLFTVAVVLLLAAPWVAQPAGKITTAGAMTLNAVVLLAALFIISVARGK